jgi:hypothetical protein
MANPTERPTTVAISDLVNRARRALAQAESAGEVLDARDEATLAYDAAKRAARMAAAKGAADGAIAAARQLQADALEIETAAQRRLADEYDAAQERGEVQSPGGDRMSKVPDRNNAPATVAQLGLSRKEIHEDRKLRDAEKEYPGLTETVLSTLLEAKEEPTRAALRRATHAALGVKERGGRDAISKAKEAALKGSILRKPKTKPHPRSNAPGDRLRLFDSLVEELAGFRRSEFEEWLSLDKACQQIVGHARIYAPSAVAMVQHFQETK